jgi:hypothetical protein
MAKRRPQAGLNSPPFPFSSQPGISPPISQLYIATICSQPENAAEEGFISACKHPIINGICLKLKSTPQIYPLQDEAGATVRAVESAFPYLISAPKPLSTVYIWIPTLAPIG